MIQALIVKEWKEPGTNHEVISIKFFIAGSDITKSIYEILFPYFRDIQDGLGRLLLWYNTDDRVLNIYIPHEKGLTLFLPMLNNLLQVEDKGNI